MPDDAKKITSKDRTYQFFPREWEGLHDAFPKMPPQVDARNPFLPNTNSVVYGAIGGAIWNSVQALRGKPLGHAVLNGIGLAVVPLMALSIVGEEIGRRSTLPDIKAILKADNIELPKRRYVQSVEGTTPDDWAIICGCVAMSGLFIYRRAPNFAKPSYLTWLGSFTVGYGVAGQELNKRLASLKPEIAKQSDKYRENLEKGKAIYCTRTGKLDNPYLYGLLDRLKQAEAKYGVSTHAMGPPVPIQSHQPHFEMPGVPSSGPGSVSEMLTARPRPEGSEPHLAWVDSNGRKIIFAQRDFLWNPETKETGLEELQEHLEDLQKHRSSSVQSAQYLWEVIAKREARQFPLYGRDEESNDVQLEKKALELLSSIHKQHYAQIADLDWCISNTQKLMLQFQADGKWLPSTSDSVGAAEARSKLLEQIRTHRKNLEVQNSTLDVTLELLPSDDGEKDKIKQAVAGNLAATAKLQAELEADDID